MTSVPSRAAMASDDSEYVLNTHKYTLKFIETYKACPELWNPSHKYYTNKFHRYEAHDKLLEVLKKIQPDATRLDVRTKINTIRSNYNKIAGKIRKAKASGKEFVPRNWMYYHLRFLDGIRKQEQNDSDSEGGSDDDNDHSESNLKAEKSPPTMCTVHVDMENLDEHDSEPTPKKRKVKPKSSQPRSDRQVESPSFAKTIGLDPQALVWSSKLQSLRADQRLFAEKAINDVLFEASLNHLKKGSLAINSGSSVAAYDSSDDDD